METDMTDTHLFHFTPDHFNLGKSYVEMKLV